jgi:hypothetical protein
MGQQQLLLLVVAVIIVAVSTVAAFYILDHYYKKDEADGLLDRSLAIATHAVYWKSKNDPFAGGNQSYIRLAEDGIGLLALDDRNIRGRYGIERATTDSLVVVGVSDRYPGVGVRVIVDRYNIDRSELRFDGTISFPQ